MWKVDFWYFLHRSYSWERQKHIFLNDKVIKTKLVWTWFLFYAFMILHLQHPFPFDPAGLRNCSSRSLLALKLRKGSSLLGGVRSLVSVGLGSGKVEGERMMRMKERCCGENVSQIETHAALQLCLCLLQRKEMHLFDSKNLVPQRVTSYKGKSGQGWKWGLSLGFYCPRMVIRKTEEMGSNLYFHL